MVNLKSSEIKYDKTRLGEENLQMLQETFSNTPSVIEDENENTHSRVIIEKQYTQNVDFIVNTAISRAGDGILEEKVKIDLKSHRENML